MDEVIVSPQTRGPFIETRTSSRVEFVERELVEQPWPVPFQPRVEQDKLRRRALLLGMVVNPEATEDLSAFDVVHGSHCVANTESVLEAAW